MQIAQRDQNETHIYSVNQDEIFLSLAQYPAPEPGMASGYVSLMYPVDFQPMPTSMPATQIDRITVLWPAKQQTAEDQISWQFVRLP